MKKMSRDNFVCCAWRGRVFFLCVCVCPQLPLFTNVDDLMTSWDRLETEGGSEAKSPTIQVSQ